MQDDHWYGWEDTGTRVDPGTGHVQEDHWYGWEDSGRRVDPASGRVQEEHWWGWEPASGSHERKSASRRQGPHSPPSSSDAGQTNDDLSRPAGDSPACDNHANTPGLGSESVAVTTSEPKRRIENPEVKRIEGLLAKIQGKSLEDLRSAWMNVIHATALSPQGQAAYMEHEAHELLLLGINRDQLNKIDDIDIVRLVAQSENDLRWAVAARERLQTLEAEQRREAQRRAEEKRRADAALLASLRNMGPDELYRFLDDHRFDEIAVLAIAQLNDKELLVQIAASFVGTPLRKPARRRYYEVLDQEQAQRNIFERIAHRLSFEYLRERNRL